MIGGTKDKGEKDNRLKTRLTSPLYYPYALVSNTVKMTHGINLKVTHLTFFRNA